MDTDAGLDGLVRDFEAATLPRSAWTHAAHLRVALWYLHRYPHGEATARIREGIRRYNAAHGRAGGYHETVTLAWVAVVAAFRAGREGEPLAALARDLVAARGDPGYLLRHYSRGRLESAEARAGWVEPDLLAFGPPDPDETRAMPTPAKVNLAAAFDRVRDHWSPKVVAELNGQHVRIVKLLGAFVWHRHEDEDELFLVVRGHLRLEFRDRVVDLEPGEFLVVPRGVEHRPVADGEVEVVLFEPAATLNTGNVREARTVDRPERI